MVMIYATGHVSGAHINPAVTLSFVATRHFSGRDALGYVPAQLVGAVAGALLLRLAWEGTPADLGATVPSVGVGSALVYEFVLTAFLMFVVMAVATDTRAVGAGAAIAIGGTVALDALFRRSRDGGVDEPRTLVRPRARRVRVDRLWTSARAALRCLRGRAPVRSDPGRAFARSRSGGVIGLRARTRPGLDQR